MHDEHDLVALGIIQCLFDFFERVSHILRGIIEVPLDDALDEVKQNTGTEPISEMVCMLNVAIAYVGLWTPSILRPNVMESRLRLFLSQCRLW